MCYCHCCSVSQLHAANSTFCCNTNTTNTTQHRNNNINNNNNCRGGGVVGCGGVGLPVNWKYFQSRCQCGVCQINFVKNFKRSLSPPKIAEFYEKEHRTEKSIMFSTSPSSELHKKKLSNHKKKDSSPILHRDVDVTKVLQSEDLKQILKGISDEKIQEIVSSKKSKKKKKKRHKKSKYKSLKSEKSENESSKRRKSRKNKKHKRSSSNTNEAYTLRRSSSSKKIYENIAKVEKMEEDNNCSNAQTISKKKNEYHHEKNRHYSGEEKYDRTLSSSPIATSTTTDEPSEFGTSIQIRKYSKSPSPDSSSNYSLNNKISKSKINISNSDSPNKLKTSQKQHEQPQPQYKNINSNLHLETTFKSHKSTKNSSNILVHEKIQDNNSNNRISRFSENKHSTDMTELKISHSKARSTDIVMERLEKKYIVGNSGRDTVLNKGSKNSGHIKGTAMSSLENPKDVKKNGNEKHFDNYNDNAISGKDLDSYVNAIMTDEYKEKKLNDFKLLEELKNNIAIKAKEKIKSIEKVSNDTFSAIPSVNKFITGILSSPESSTNNNYPSIPTVPVKPTTNNETEEIAQKKCKFIDENSKISRELSEEKVSSNKIRENNENEDYETTNKVKARRLTRSRSKSRYSTTGSSDSTPRSKYSYSSSRYSHSYSRSSSRSSASLSHSRSRSRSHSRSPSIPRRRGSPSFLERRRITSARKRPVPYNRPQRSSSDQNRQIVCNTYTTIIRKYQPSI